ncbi:MAG: helicase [Burkholderiaceae bacterium]|nr:helicase [Burkholderiaceae bacterium]
MPDTPGSAPPADAPAAAPNSARPRPPPLPQSRHLARVPPGIGADDLHRVRNAAYQLPQVVAAHDLPADLVAEHAADADERLDKLGLVLLQRGVPGQRPSRWIAPELIAEALRHLDAVGTAPKLRALMAERREMLEAMGISRAGPATWERQATHVLTLVQHDWRLEVIYLTPLDGAPVWRFFRDGDKATLLLALRQVRDYPHAAELQTALDRLVEQAGHINPGRIDSLLPGLQSECATPQPIAALKAACNRALDRWANRVNELDTLEDLTAELAFRGYPDSFKTARRANRRVTLFVGPPNSGKTHQAFERLAAAERGAYLAPLRLLALEGRDRLMARGVPCSLRTGEEFAPVDGARVVSSTIEMMDTGTLIDVAVIDEAQMIFDPWRGWAWTQAIVGAPARELLIICSAYAVPAIENLLGLCGERCEVRPFERMQQVQLLAASVPIASLKLGDAVVAFSRREVLMLRDQVAENGKTVSVIYGALPPEVRRREAERFATGETEVLVATDAIGMGLNLPIRRVLFSTMTKFDGVADRTLDESEVHQIAGRAGRYGIHEEGFAGVLAEAEPGAGRLLKDLLALQPRAPRHFKAPVAPNWWHVETIAGKLGKRRLREVLAVFVEQLALDNQHFAVAELAQMIEIAGQLDERAAPLSLRERFIYAQAPVDTRTDQLMQMFLGWTERHAWDGAAGEPDFLYDVDERSRLERMEQALRACTLWLWLDQRFPGVFGFVDEVVALRERLNDGIAGQLRARRPLWQVRPGGRPGSAPRRGGRR